MKGLIEEARENAKKKKWGIPCQMRVHGVKLDGCSENRSLFKERDSEYEEEWSTSEEGYLNRK